MWLDRKSLVWPGALVAACAFFLVVWPTPFLVYERDGMAWRVNRVTGVKEFSTSRGWRSQEAFERERQAENAVLAAKWRPEVEAAVASLKNIGPALGLNQFAVYNPSEWTFRLMDVKVESFSAGPPEKRRRLAGKVEPATYTELAATSDSTVDLPFLSDVRLSPAGYSNSRPTDPEGTAGHAVQEVTLRVRHAKKPGVEGIVFDPPIVAKFILAEEGGA